MKRIPIVALVVGALLAVGALLMPAPAHATLPITLDEEDSDMGDALQDNYWKEQNNGDITCENVLDGVYLDGYYCVEITYTEHGKKPVTKRYKLWFDGGDSKGADIPDGAEVNSVKVVKKGNC